MVGSPKAAGGVARPLAAATAPGPVNGDPGDGQRRGDGGKLNFGLGCLLGSPLAQPPDVAGRADPVGE